jgi:hypothetical protein
MKTAEEVRALHDQVIHNAIDEELNRITAIIEKHIAERNREAGIAIQLDRRTSNLIKIRLTSLGYQVRESEYDPRQPDAVLYTYISW